MYKLIIAAIMISLLASCSLSDRDVADAELEIQRYEYIRKVYVDMSSLYEGQKQSDEFNRYRKYAIKEKWQNNLDMSKTHLAYAKDISLKIKRIIKADSNSDTKTIKSLTIDLVVRYNKAKRLNHITRDRLKLLMGSFKEAKAIYNRSRGSMIDAIGKMVDVIETKYDKVAKDWPRQKEYTVKEMKKYFDLENKADDLVVIIEDEYSKADSNDMDIVRFTDSYGKLKDISKSLRLSNLDIAHLNKELYVSEVRILEDMKAWGKVRVATSSWDSDSDYDDTTNYTFPSSTVSYENGLYLDNCNNNIATYRSNWGSNLSVKISSAAWADLGVSFKKGFGWGDDEGDMFVNSVSFVYHHKYITIINGKKTSKWKVVDEDMFHDYVDDVGMEIYSKPYGFYEREVIVTSAPPGMSLMGNEKYGKWDTVHSIDGDKTYWDWNNDNYFMLLYMGETDDNRRSGRYSKSSYTKYRNARNAKKSRYTGTKSGKYNRASEFKSSARYKRPSGVKANTTRTHKSHTRSVKSRNGRRSGFAKRRSGSKSKTSRSRSRSSSGSRSKGSSFRGRSYSGGGK